MFLAVTHTVDEEIVRLLAGRRGHLLLASGDHADLWLDLDGVFVRPTRVARFAGELATRLAAHEIFGTLRAPRRRAVRGRLPAARRSWRRGSR
jgi:hypothetical protein